MMSASFGITLLFFFLVMLHGTWDLQFSHVQFFVTPWTATHQASLSPSLTPGTCSNWCPSSQWCQTTISFSIIPFSSCLQSSPHQGLFQWGRPALYRQETNNLLGRQIIVKKLQNRWGLAGGLIDKEICCNAGDLDLIPGSGRSPGEGNGNPLQYSCLENSMDRGAWQVTVHGAVTVGHDLATKPQISV